MDAAKSGRDAFRPEWVHRELVLPIGAGKYRFRTLSLYDVWCLWPHLAPMSEALHVGKPLAWTRHALAAIEVVNRELPQEAADLAKMTGTHVDALLEFYAEQDWARIAVLGEESGEADTAAGGEAGEADVMRRRFFAICAASARLAGMSVADFVERRFEFCADAIIALRDSLRAERDGSGNAMNIGQFLTVAAAMTENVKLDPTNKPAWIMEIEEKTKLAN